MDLCCVACCTARSYKLLELIELFNPNHKTTRYRDVIHVAYNNKDVFIFDYGCIVAWSLDEDTVKALVQQIKPYEIEPNDTHEFDEFTYTYGNPPRMYLDKITLPQEDEILEKLAVSYGLAQSGKLSSFEHRIEKTIGKTEAILRNLAEKGKIPFTRKEISQKIGELFIERNSVNLYGDLLDTPEFFWEYPELEHLYKMAVNDLDIKSRTEILNCRLDIIRETFSILGDELNHRHALRLEWIIILLILIEVLMSLYNVVF